MTSEFKEKSARVGILAIATGGFVGFFPVAPGTMGSALAMGYVWLNRGSSFAFDLIFLIALLVLGVWASDRAGKILNKPDASPLVIDEIVGILITMLGIPVTPFTVFWGFLWFRFFDIFKLPPANIADSRVKGGLGVMLDDVVAGVYANILLHLMLRAQF